MSRISEIKFFLLSALVALLTQHGGSRRIRDKSGGLRGNGVGVAEPQKALLAELEEALGSDHQKVAEDRLHEFEDELKTTFNALPKNDRGAIEAPSVRYALHRLFNQRHGWQIRGLETGGGAWDAESPIAAMGDKVPSKMRELFEDRLGNFGLNLHELAVLAATMDSMLRSDVSSRFEIVYKAYKQVTEVDLVRKDAIRALNSYIASFVLGSRVERLTMAEVRTNERRFDSVFPRHQAAKDLLMNIVDQLAGSKEFFDFDLMIKVGIAFGQKLGSLEDKECQAMKSQLMTKESSPGRLRLGDFYGPDLGHFSSESAEYLRSNGALDESVPEDPKVIIPNYLAMPSNCVSPSGYYEICCFDECEQLMDHIEAEIKAPTASAESIASVVSSLSSRSQVANGTLTPVLTRLLNDVAEYHGGSVPIHGRLFAQWMHQAFPRECNYPSDVSASDRFEKNLPYMVTPQATNAERKKYGAMAEEAAPESNEAPLWTMQEQLVDAKALEVHVKRSSYLQDIFLFGAAGFVGMAMLKLMMGPTSYRRKDTKLL